MIDKLKHTIRQLLKEEHPDLFQPHYPVKARVVRKYLDPAVDLQILSPSGSADPDIPVIPRVKTESTFEVGHIVRVGFYYNDPNMPFVEGRVTV